jgi:hypothetical protein
LFKFHSSATAKTEATPLQIRLKILAQNGNAGREALNDGNEFRSMGFTRSKPTKHALSLA